MKEKIKQSFDKVKTKLSSINKKIRILAVVILLIAVAVVVVIAFNRTDAPYVVLFSGLSSEDMTAVQSFLDENGVSTYRVEDSSTITVPAENEFSIRALLVQQNYPKTGFAYRTYLDNIGTLSSNSDREILSLFELQDRLGATIRCINGIQEATVLITKSQDSRYILDSENIIPATASIMVQMQDGKDLPEELGAAIRNFVSTAVQNLRFENITVSDTNGNTYTGEIVDEGVSTEDSSALKLSLEAQVNETLRNNVLRILIPVFGADHVGVSVSSTVDVSRSYHDETTYEEPEWAADGSTRGEGIIGTKVWSNSIRVDEDETFGGVVGTSTNADLNEYVERYTPTGNEKELSGSGEINYNVDTYHAQREEAGGVVTDVMVSVSIDSDYAGNADALALRSHVARAAKIGPDLEAAKVSVLIAPFYKEPVPEEEEPSLLPEDTGIPTWVYVCFFLGLTTFIILLSVIIVMRRRAVRRARRRAEELAEQRRLEAEAQAKLLAAMAAEQQEPKEGADIMEDIHSERSMELRMNVREFAEQNPEICAQMVKSWLKGGDDHG